MTFLIPPRKATTSLAVVFFTILLPGCVLMDMRKNGRDQQTHGMVAVQVSPVPSVSPATYAVAFPATGIAQGTPISAQKVPTDGLTAFLLPSGTPVNIAVFTDENSNRQFDKGEPSGALKSITPSSLADVGFRGAVRPLVLTFGKSGVPAGLKLPTATSEQGAAVEINLGEVVSLNDPRFSAANGTVGFWQPFDFLTKLGWGIYFLQPYDAKKIPVVFVYGINGSPQDWRSMIASLDRSKYQPWFFHYPSGIRLEKASNGLSRGLQLLKSRYGFTKMYVVAHSMGGLVACGGIEQAITESGTNFIPKFITLCTPWGGDSAADGGVQHLKYPVPAWIDMEPGSAYLKSLFANKFPPGTKHFLIFDFQSKNAPWLKPDNDGVVQVASELFPAAQSGAVAMFGFNYGHVETLGKKDVHDKVNEYLAQ